MQSVLSRFGNLGVTSRNTLLGARVGQRWIFRPNSGYLGGQKLTDYAVLWISAAFVVMGVAVLINAGSGPSKSSSPARWPTTFGRIVSVQVVERESGDEARWFPQVSYQYSIQGRTMVNTHLTRGSEISWRDRTEANHFLERYIARSRVLVYYNPNDVADAVLEPSSGGLEPATWAGIVMVFLGLGVVLIYDRLS
jgi:hypothetical protein